jgi:hypothetical protein
MGGGLPALLDGFWCCWRSGVSSALSPWSASISVVLSWAKRFLPQLAEVDSRCRYYRLLDSVVGFVCRFPVSSSLHTEFLDGWRCKNCLLSWLFPLSQRPLRTAVKSCSIPVNVPYRVSPPRTCSMTALASRCFCMVFSYSSLRDLIRFHQSFWNSEVCTLAMARVTTTIIITITYRRNRKHLICTGPQPGRGRDSYLLHQTGEGREFTTYSYSGNFVWKLSAVGNGSISTCPLQRIHTRR